MLLWLPCQALWCCKVSVRTAWPGVSILFLGETASLVRNFYRSVAARTIVSPVCLFVGCLKSQQQVSVSQGRICSDYFTCCHTSIEVADQTFYLTQSQYTDTGPTSPSADPITPGAWQGSHWSANFEVTGMTRPQEKSRRKRDSNPGSSALEADALTTRPTRRSVSVDPSLRYTRMLSNQPTNKQLKELTHL